VRAENRTHAGTLQEIESEDALLEALRQNPDLATARSQWILEQRLAINRGGQFSGYYNASRPNVDDPKFRDDYPGFDSRSEAMLKHLQSLTAKNFAQHANLLNYILSWSRDDMVNTWSYFLDWKFHGNRQSLERCMATYRALLDFYGTGKERERITTAIRRYDDGNGRRSSWKDDDASISPRINPVTDEGIPQDRNVALQLDVVGQLLIMTGLLMEDPEVKASFMESDFHLIHDLTRKGGYLDSMDLEDYGVWEEGENSFDKDPETGQLKDRRRIAEMHTSSVTLLEAGLKKIRELAENGQLA
jgi:hypothetical protein